MRSCGAVVACLDVDNARLDDYTARSGRTLDRGHCSLGMAAADPRAR